MRYFKQCRSCLRRTNNRGFTVIELIASIAIISILLSLLLVGASGFIKDARRAAAYANARTLYTYACNELLSETSGLSQYLARVKPTAPFKVLYSGAKDNCHKTSDAVLIDKLKRDILVGLPAIEDQGFRLYLIQDSTGQYQIEKAVVFTEHPEYADFNDSYTANGCYPVGSYEKMD